MRLCTTTKVINSSEYYRQIKLLQPGNCEWVTVIEAVNMTDWNLSSYIILKIQNTQES